MKDYNLLGSILAPSIYVNEHVKVGMTRVRTLPAVGVFCGALPVAGRKQQPVQSMPSCSLS